MPGAGTPSAPIRLVESDLKCAAELLARSYYPDPLPQNLLQGVQTTLGIGALCRFFELYVRQRARDGHVVGIKHEGRLVAAGTYCSPIEHGTSFRQILLKVKLVLCLAPLLGVARAFRFAFLDAALDRYRPPELHYYAEFGGAGIDPRRRELMSSLLYYIINRADREGVGVFADITNASHLPIWRRLGFEVAKNAKILGINVWFLWRKPNGMARTTN